MVHPLSSFPLLEGYDRVTPSPLLFLLVMEVFTRMLRVATTAGLLAGFSVGRLNKTTTIVSQLLFADDTIIFYDNVCEQIVNLRNILI